MYPVPYTVVRDDVVRDDVVQLLLQHRAHVNAQSISHITALHLAFGYLYIVQPLLRHRAASTRSPSCTSTDKMTRLQIAVLRGHIEVIAGVEMIEATLSTAWQITYVYVTHPPMSHLCLGWHRPFLYTVQYDTA